jgi:hypothetical protein
LRPASSLKCSPSSPSSPPSRFPQPSPDAAWFTMPEVI